MKINSISTQQYKYNNQQKATNKNNTPAFKGFYETVAGSKPFQSVVGKLAKSDKTFTYIMLAESCLLSGFYMINTLRNKKIEKEQKPQMVINDALVLGVSSAGALFFDDKVTKVMNNISKKYFAKPETQAFYKDLGNKFAQANKQGLLDEAAKGAEAVGKKVSEQLKSFNLPKEKLADIVTKAKSAFDNGATVEKAKETLGGFVDDIYAKTAKDSSIATTSKGINKIKTLVIFGIIYRYIGPVIVTPIANKISSKFFDNKAQKAEKSKTEATPEKK